MLSGEEYRLMEVDLNKKQFLQPLDSDNTKANIYYIRQKFMRYARTTWILVIDQVRLIRGRYCDHRCLGYWREVILEQNCNKGRIMSFLYWICETYLAAKRKKGKRKSVNQYWRDFKMLYRRVNGAVRGCKRLKRGRQGM